MSIELKQAAEQALKELDEARKIVRASSSRQLAKDWDRRATDALANLRTAIQQAEAQQPATGEPVQADSSEHLRVIASLGAALRRLSFAAQTTGGTAGPDTELQSAIGQAEQALSLGGIWQAMSATGEPVEWLDAMLTDTRETFDADGGETPQVVRDVIEYVASWVTVYREKNHPAPSAPADIDALIHRVSVAICLSHSAWDLADARVLVLEILKQAGPSTQKAHTWTKKTYSP
jgi:hypothetical protein